MVKYQLIGVILHFFAKIFVGRIMLFWQTTKSLKFVKTNYAEIAKLHNVWIFNLFSIPVTFCSYS